MKHHLATRKRSTNRRGLEKLQVRRMYVFPYLDANVDWMSII